MGIAVKDFDSLEAQSSDSFKKYANFRRNLRLLRATTDLSQDGLGKTLGFKKFHRLRSLEIGKGAAPRLEEAEAIAKFFSISVGSLLYNKAKIIFEEDKSANEVLH